MFKRIVIVLGGSALMGLGLGLCLLSGLGADPLGVLWDGLAIQTGLSVGTISIILNVIMLVVVFFLEPKQIHIGTLITPLLVSVCIDLVLLLPGVDNFVLKLLMVLAGIVMIAFSSALIARAELGKGSYDALIYGLEKRTGIPLSYCRYGFDILFLGLGFVCGGTIGIGTILCLLLIAPIMQYFRNKLFGSTFSNLMNI